MSRPEKREKTRRSGVYALQNARRKIGTVLSTRLHFLIVPLLVTGDAFRVVAWRISSLGRRATRTRMGPCWNPTVHYMQAGGVSCPFCPFALKYGNTFLVRFLCGNSRVLPGEQGRAVCICAREQFKPAFRGWFIGLCALLCIWTGVVVAGGMALWQSRSLLGFSRGARSQFLPVADKRKSSDISDSERKKALDFIRNAKAYLESKRYSAARIEYRSAIQRDPTLIDAYTGLAECCLQLGFFAEAREALGRVITLDPASPMAYRKLTELAGRQRDFKQAFVHARKLCDLQPKDKDARLLLGSCYIAIGDITNAEREVTLAISLAPRDPEPLLAAAYVETLKKNPDGAEKYYRDTIALSATNVPARIGLARIYGDSGRADEAAGFLGAILKTQPQCADAIIEMGLLKCRQGKWQEAVEMYRRASSLYPKLFAVREELVRLLMSLGRINEGYDIATQLIEADSENMTAHVVLAETFLDKGFVSLAEEYDRKALRINPNLVAAHRLMARILMKKGDLERSLDYFKRIAAALPDDIESQLRLAFCIELKGDRDAAIHLLQQTAARFPESPLPHVHLGEAYQRAKQVDKAAVSFRQAVLRKPENPIAMNNLAAIILDQAKGEPRNLDEAFQLASRAWQLAPENAGVADTLGWANFQKGNYDEAMVLLYYAHKRAPSSPDVLYHLGCVFHAKGSEGKAVELFEEALALSSTFSGAEKARDLLQNMKRQRTGR